MLAGMIPAETAGLTFAELVEYVLRAGPLIAAVGIWYFGNRMERSNKRRAEAEKDRHEQIMESFKQASEDRKAALAQADKDRKAALAQADKDRKAAQAQADEDRKAAQGQTKTARRRKRRQTKTARRRKRTRPKTGRLPRGCWRPLRRCSAARRRRLRRPASGPAQPSSARSAPAGLTGTALRSIASRRRFPATPCCLSHSRREFSRHDRGLSGPRRPLLMLLQSPDCRYSTPPHEAG